MRLTISDDTQVEITPSGDVEFTIRRRDERFTKVRAKNQTAAQATEPGIPSPLVKFTVTKAERHKLADLLISDLNNNGDRRSTRYRFMLADSSDF